MGHLYNKLVWLLFGLITLTIFVALAISTPLDHGGDIVEYFGMTESLMKDNGLSLSDDVYNNLKQSLNPGYFVDVTSTPQNGGFLYYIPGINGKLYPVHFFFYSLLAVPIRVVLSILHINELHTLRFTNLLLLSAAVFIVLKYFLKKPFQRYILLLLVYLSPILSFIIWPGPDMYYLSLLLVAVFLFYKNKHLLTALCLTLASWHSQPLIVLAAASIGYYLFTRMRPHKTPAVELSLKLEKSTFLSAAGLILLLLLPYITNLFLFGVLTPWTILEDGWTQLYGFGIRNIHIQKLFEQFFDLDVGLAFYAPVLVFVGGFFLIRDMRRYKETLWLGILLLTTALFYQTNPAWHYGTAGFGPTRHALFLIPFFIYFCVKHLRPTLVHVFFLLLLLVPQVGILAANGFLMPTMINTLYHSPYATYILDHFPALYNPTPEIFFDRTTHTDYKYPRSAIYVDKGVCKKAYILKTDVSTLVSECGGNRDDYLTLFDNDFERKANYPRRVKTIKATFWPDPGSCGKNFFPTDEKPYVCMHTIDDVVRHTGVRDKARFEAVEDLPGVWHMKEGDVVEITIPPGYFIHHYSFDGAYVNF